MAKKKNEFHSQLREVDTHLPFTKGVFQSFCVAMVKTEAAKPRVCTALIQLLGGQQ